MTFAPNTDPPAPEELEISLFGPGFGECVLLHIGDGEWVQIDSCVDHKTRRPVSLEYLSRLGIDSATAIKHVIVSHWHDDHVRGIGEVVRSCRDAAVYVSAALRTEEFLKLVAAYNDGAMMESTGVDEFASVFAALQEQGRNPRWVTKDRILLESEKSSGEKPVHVRLFTLSPSDAAVTLLKLNLANLLPRRYKPKRRVTAPKENNDSIAVHVSIGSLRILLGADLEVHRNPNIGWDDVLNNQTIKIEQAQVFKVPHHGGDSAHHPRVWKELLIPNPLAIMTAFRWGSKAIPTRADVSRILGFTTDSYITSSPFTRGRIKRSSFVEKMSKEVVKYRLPANLQLGHIQLRTRIDDPANLHIGHSRTARALSSL